jgi:hypothetical protein
MTHDPTNLHAHGLLRRVARSAGTPVGAADLAGMSEDLRAVLRRIQDDFRSGQATTCRHNPTPDSTSTVLAAGWRPGFYACSACSFFFVDAPNVVRKATCNVCHRAIPGDRLDNRPWSAAIQLDQLLIQLDLCAGCLPASAFMEQPRPLRMRIGPRGRRGKGRGKGGRR